MTVARPHNFGGSARNLQRDLDAAGTEADWQREVLAYAHKHGWLCAHFRAARTDKGYRTAMSGDVGFPDCVFARDGVVVLAELKALGKEHLVTAYQRRWLEAAGGKLWTPANREEMQLVLA